MKKFLLCTLICVAMITSCQKQDSAAEHRLAQREAALDIREKALDDREKALTERERALSEVKKAIGNVSTISPELQGQTSDPAHAKAEREKRIEQLPAEIRALVPDPSQVNSIRFDKKAKAAQTELQGQNSDAAQGKAEREKRIQQLPAEIRALIPDAPRIQADGAATRGQPSHADSSSPSPSPAPQ